MHAPLCVQRPPRVTLYPYLLFDPVQFISETELQEIKSTMGLRPEDGTIAADKPLAEARADCCCFSRLFQLGWLQLVLGRADSVVTDNSLAEVRAATCYFICVLWLASCCMSR